MNNVIITKINQILGERFLQYKTPIIDLIQAKTNDPFKILVGTLLSARTKDETTAKVLQELFKVVNTPEDLSKFTIEELEKLIYPIGFYHNKAKFLHELGKELTTKFESKVPETIEELVTLPGVGRKTANLVVIMAFRQPAMCVDIHVHRISNRFGYIQTKTPLESEMKLRKILPQELWLNYNSYLVAFGQNHCLPVNPKCSDCPVYEMCERIGVKTKHIRKDV